MRAAILMGAQKTIAAEHASQAGSVEAQVMTLREVADRYAGGCPFKPGDLVTPRKGYRITEAGLPHIVIEVFAEPHRFEDHVTCYSDEHLVRLDMRLARVSPHDGSVTAFVGESWRFEPYPEGEA